MWRKGRQTLFPLTPPNPSALAPPPLPAAALATGSAGALHNPPTSSPASLSSSPSSLSPEQRRRADTNLALARARRNLRLAESKAQGTRAPVPPCPLGFRPRVQRIPVFPFVRSY